MMLSYMNKYGTYTKPFKTRERLQESLHLFDTQQNEAMNTPISKYSSKTKTYGMTISLTNCVLISVGISNLTAIHIGCSYTQLSVLQWQPKPPPSSCIKTPLASIEQYIQREQILKVRERRITTIKLRK